MSFLKIILMACDRTTVFNLEHNRVWTGYSAYFSFFHSVQVRAKSPNLQTNHVLVPQFLSKGDLLLPD